MSDTEMRDATAAGGVTKWNEQERLEIGRQAEQSYAKAKKACQVGLKRDRDGFLSRGSFFAARFQDLEPK
jgi:hypothetical protein